MYHKFLVTLLGTLFVICSFSLFGQGRRGYTAVSQETPATDVRMMKDQGANLVRWMLYRTATVENKQDWSAYQKWVNTQLIVLDRVMDSCEKTGIKVVVDLHPLQENFILMEVNDYFTTQHIQDNMWKYGSR